MSETDPRDVLRDIETDHYFRHKRKRWHWPRFSRYVIAEPGLRFALNRYPHHVIGAGVAVGRYCYAVKWASL